ncbi:MAG TPA: MFS transporter, partial [Usitatibacter sp.]|nr:MFS transporter [Usitatibacter sp.]
FIGVVGAALAGAPLRMAVDAFGWRGVMAASAAATAAVAVAIWIVVRDDPAERGYASHSGERLHAAAPSIAAQLVQVARYRNAWLVLAIPGAFSAILFAFAGLWGVPFLVSQYGFGTASAALVATAMLVAWALGGLFFAPLSERLRRRVPVLAGGLAATLALWSIVVLVPGLAPAALVAILLAVAFCAGAFIVVFAFAKESVPAGLAGTASGIANMGVMLGGMLMQPLVGYVLDRHGGALGADGARIRDFAAYRAGFALTFAWGAASLALLAFARETRCRQAA